MASSRTLWWVLRVGAALCFIGHGAFGLITKEAWVPFFGIAGIGRDAAFTLMPIVGAIDIVVGLTVLITPRPAALVYMAVWALWTAALRPLTGASAFEMLERAGNYGVPLAMLLMCQPRGGWRAWFAAATLRPMTPIRERALRATLLATCALLLLGHGTLGLTGAPSLTGHYAAVGLAPESAAAATPVVGWLELALVALLVLRPSAGLAFAIAGWKVAAESLWLMAGAPVWEFVERAGSYAAPLAFALTMRVRSRSAPAAKLSGLTRVAAIAAISVITPLATPTTAFAQQRDSLPWQERIRQLDDASLLAALRAGGLVLACRHAITPDGVRDRSETERALQRNLSEEGRQQAIAIGRAVRAARIGVCPVLSSPMFRTRETAELAFGDTAVVISQLLRGGKPPMSELMTLFTQSPPEGQNRVLMTHQGTLYRILTMFRPPEIREGDCVVLRPNHEAGTFEVVAKVSLADWERLAKL